MGPAGGKGISLRASCFLARPKTDAAFLPPGFTHRENNTFMEFKSPLPQDMVELLEALRMGVGDSPGPKIAGS